MKTPLIASIIANILVFVYNASRIKVENIPSNIKVHLASKLIPKWAAAQTYGVHIFITMRVWSSPLDLKQTLKHEMVHTEQWRRYGFFGFGFLFTYLYYTVRYGYKNNPLEIEARKKSGEPV